MAAPTAVYFLRLCHLDNGNLRKLSQDIMGRHNSDIALAFPLRGRCRRSRRMRCHSKHKQFLLLSPQSDGQDHVFEFIAAVGGHHYAGRGVRIQAQQELVRGRGLERVHKVFAVEADLQTLAVALAEADVLSLADGSRAQAVDEILVEAHAHRIFCLFIDDERDAVDNSQQLLTADLYHMTKGIGHSLSVVEKIALEPAGDYDGLAHGEIGRASCRERV